YKPGFNDLFNFDLLKLNTVVTRLTSCPYDHLFTSGKALLGITQVMLESSTVIAYKNSRTNCLPQGADQCSRLGFRIPDRFCPAGHLNIDDIGMADLTDHSIGYF